MKWFLLHTVPLLSILLCGTAFAAEPEIGKMHAFTVKFGILHGAFMISEIPLQFDRNLYFKKDDYSKATTAFKNCVMDARTQDRLAEITVKVKSITKDKKTGKIWVEMEADESSTCQPLNISGTRAIEGQHKMRHDDR